MPLHRAEFDDKNWESMATMLPPKICQAGDLVTAASEEVMVASRHMNLDGPLRRASSNESFCDFDTF